MLKRNKNTKKLRFEGLESRTLMAGDVTAAVVDGVLQIAGDAADNSIQIQQSGKAWRVQGIDTTVNGGNSVQNFTGVTKIYINLGIGNDSIDATNGKLRERFSIQDDGGSTVINLSKIVAGGIHVFTHDGSDTITVDKCAAPYNDMIIESFATSNDQGDVVAIRNSKVSFDLGPIVRTGSGDDIVTIESMNGCATQIETSFKGEIDQDTVSISKLRFLDQFQIRTGDGPDTITLNDIRSERGFPQIFASDSQDDTSIDIVRINQLKANESLEIQTGDGADEVTLVKCNIGQNIAISTAGTAADGDDIVTMTQIKSGNKINILTGDGADTAALTKLVTDVALNVDMGGGDSDQLRLAQSRVLEALLLGYEGNDDTATLSRNKWKGKLPDVVGFEQTNLG